MQALDRMFEERIASCPLLSHTVRQLEAVFGGPPEDRAPACRRLLLELISSGGLAEAINFELHRCVAGKQIDIWPGKDFNFILHKSPMFLLEIRIVSAQQSSSGERLISAVEDQYYSPLLSPMKLRCFRQVHPFPEDQLDTSRRLVDLGVMQLEPGWVHAVAAGHDLFEIVKVDVDTPVVILHAPSKMRHHWIYDRQSLCPTLLMSADQSTARIQYALRVLAALESHDSLPVVESLMDHPDHFIRWEVVRQAFQIDVAAGKRLLERALTDPHPEVRQAAKLTAREYTESCSAA
jgi:hypothetical protein